jgi:hypothetical protein
MSQSHNASTSDGRPVARGMTPTTSGCGWRPLDYFCKNNSELPLTYPKQKLDFHPSDD